MISKKKLLLCIILIFMIGIIVSNKQLTRMIEVKSQTYGTPANSAFSDEYLYKCVVNAYNEKNNTTLGYDTNLTDVQLESITSLSCPGDSFDEAKQIVYTNGLEKLINLEYLRIDNNKIISLDLSNNVYLKELYLYDNPLTNIDLSNNLNLEVLNIGDTHLNSINLSNNSELKMLYMNNTFVNDDGYYLTNIDLSNNTKLIELQLTYNKFSDLDLSANTSLAQVNLSHNELTNIKLNDLIQQINLGYNKLSSIDLSMYTNLRELYLYNNELSNIDLSHNPLLKSLNLSNNQFTNIDLNHNSKLEDLYLSNNKLTNIDLSHNITLKKLKLDNNKLIDIDLEKNIYLTGINLESNKLSNLDLSNNIELQNLYLIGNGLKGLDLSSNLKLENIELFDEEGILGGQVERRYLYNDELLYEDDEVLKRLIIENKYETNKNDIYLNQIFTYKTDNDFYYISPTNDNIYFPFEYDVLYYKLLKNIGIEQLLKINDSKSYIYIGTEKNFDFISNNTHFGIRYLQDNRYTTDNIPSGISTEIGGNNYIIKYNGKIIKIFKIININSNKYDLAKDYLYGNYDEIQNNINVNNGTLGLNLISNKIEIKHNDDVLQEFDYVGYTSDKYDLSKDYIKVNDNNIQSLLSNINCINCNVHVYDGTNNLTSGNFGDNQILRIMHNDDLIKEYELKYSVSGVELNKSTLKLNLDTKKSYQLSADVLPASAENKNVTWESSNPSVATVDENGLVTAIGLGEATITVKTEDGEFTDTCNVVVSEITTYTVTFKDGENTYTSEFEENEDIIFKTDLENPGYELVGWKYNNHDYSLTDKLPMPSNDIELEAIWELVVPEIENYESDDNNITGISLKTNVDNLNLGIDSIYQVKVSKHDGSDKTSGLVGTGDKVKIYLDNQLVSEYDVIIKGDVTGTGTSTVSDVAKLYQYLKGKVTMDDCYVKAGNVVDSDSTIKVNDVAKLYQFIKGKINNL